MKTTNSKQFEMLVRCMEQQPQVARGQTKGSGKVNMKQEWEQIAKTLNSYGPPERDGDSWHKVWCDMKSNIKRKIIHNVRDSNNPVKERRPYILSALQETVAQLMGFDRLMGDADVSLGPTHPTPPSGSASPSTTNFEFATTSMSSNPAAADDNDAEYYEGINSDDNQQPQSHDQSERMVNRFRRNSLKDRLLRKQTEVQTALYKEISQHLQETHRYQKRRCELEETRLRLYKIKMERVERQRQEENKLKLMEIELLKRRLDLEERKLGVIEVEESEEEGGEPSVSGKRQRLS